MKRHSLDEPAALATNRIPRESDGPLMSDADFCRRFAKIVYQIALLAIEAGCSESARELMDLAARIEDGAGA
jgi:hypothetical protein